MGYADLEKTDKGYLVNTSDWNEQVAQEIADAEELGPLTERHWDVINYLREEFLDNGGNQPNERTIAKAMTDKWGSCTTNDLYKLYPMQPSKQATKVAGLPETKRKGGY